MHILHGMIMFAYYPTSGIMISAHLFCDYKVTLTAWDNVVQ